MKNTELSAESVNRLALGYVEKYACSLEQAMEQLKTFRLQLECGESIRSSLPLQAALLTAINTASRAFLGGVYLSMPEDVGCLMRWEDGQTLNSIAISLGATVVDTTDPDLLTLTFGLRSDAAAHKVEVAATNWQGAMLVDGEEPPAIPATNLPLGGIYAAGLAVASAFLKTAGIHPQALDKSTGLSLWRPGTPWLTPAGEGPDQCLLPATLWILGLGHLGQAALWSIGLLPYPDPVSVKHFLMDFDQVADANLSAGLLCTPSDIERLKTRVGSDWLERRGIRSQLIERKFDRHFRRQEGEPVAALCGFDNAQARHPLEKAGFDYIVEAALGGSVDDFDRMVLHTFPSELHRAEIEWEDAPVVPAAKRKVLDAIRDDKKECGILELTIAGKAASASFTGACAGALMVAELIRGLNGGLRTHLLVQQLRFQEDIASVPGEKRYDDELGYCAWQKSKPFTEGNVRQAS